MYRLIYTSRSVSDLSSDEISVILSQARRRNAEDGITGGKALITLEQLEDRLSVAETVRTSDRKKEVIAVLQQYLSTSTGEGTIAAE